ncbi:MAG: serine hydrolase domain-containing protein [Actinomycetes bacterium]
MDEELVDEEQVDETRTSADVDARRSAVLHGLLPIMRIADRPLRSTLTERMHHHACPGVGIAVMHDGRIDWADGFGRRHADRPDPVGPETVFMAASCSKPVTAMLVLQQVDRGVLDLDTDVNTYLRRWHVPPNEFTVEQPVTLRHLLSHTAGVTVNGFGATVNDGRPVADVFDLLAGRPPARNAPILVDKPYDGTDRYSGGGYVIAQLVLEDVLDATFDRIADEHLLTPLGMTRSSFVHPLTPRLRDDVAAGHGDDGRPHPGDWMISSEMAAGGLFSTARDYATFLLACRDAWLGVPGAVLGRSLAQEMTTRHGHGVFGLGVKVMGDGSTARINHGGSNDGYQSETNLYLESGDGAVVLTHAVSGIYLFREILNGIADVYDWPAYMPAPKRLHTFTEADLQRYVGEYRIELGIELPLLRVWAEDGRLFNEIPGLRFGVQEVFCDTDGVLFNQTGPFETRTVDGPDGRVAALHVYEGDVEIIRATRVAAP